MTEIKRTNRDLFGRSESQRNLFVHRPMDIFGPKHMISLGYLMIGLNIGLGLFLFKNNLISVLYMNNLLWFVSESLQTLDNCMPFA